MIDFGLIFRSLPRLIEGARYTLLITSFSITFGVCLGIIISSGRLSKIWPLKALAGAYVAFLRGTPMIVQIYIVYFGLPQLGLQFTRIVAGIIALSLNSGAYMGEIFRGGIQSIDVGQTQAGLSLGFTPFQVFRYIVFPQAFRRVIPSMGNEFITLTKDSSLLSFFGVTELMYRGRQVAVNTYEYFTMYIGIALIYFVATYTMSQLLMLLERRLSPDDRDSGFKKILRRQSGAERRFGLS